MSSPLHPLFVHLPVIAVPVAALMTLILALVPQGAPRWVVPTFIVSTLGTLGAGLATMSGEALAALAALVTGVLAGHEGAVLVCIKEA